MAKECGPGEVLRKGYTATRAGKTVYVPPSCVPGSKVPESKKWFKGVEGDLGGWHKDLPAEERHRILTGVARSDSYSVAVKRLTAVANVTRDKETKKAMRADAEWLKSNRSRLELEARAPTCPTGESRSEGHYIVRGRRRVWVPGECVPDLSGRDKPIYAVVKWDTFSSVPDFFSTVAHGHYTEITKMPDGTWGWSVEQGVGVNNLEGSAPTEEAAKKAALRKAYELIVGPLEARREVGSVPDEHNALKNWVVYRSFATKAEADSVAAEATRLNLPLIYDQKNKRNYPIEYKVEKRPFKEHPELPWSVVFRVQKSELGLRVGDDPFQRKSMVIDELESAAKWVAARGGDGSKGTELPDSMSIAAVEEVNADIAGFMDMVTKAKQKAVPTVIPEQVAKPVMQKIEKHWGSSQVWAAASKAGFPPQALDDIVKRYSDSSEVPYAVGELLKTEFTRLDPKLLINEFPQDPEVQKVARATGVDPDWYKKESEKYIGSKGDVDRVKASKEIKKALLEKFPGVKFKVRLSRYSGGNSISVHWTDGPTSKEVESITSQYEHVRYDPIVGETLLGGSSYVSAQRRESKEAMEWATKFRNERYGATPWPNAPRQWEEKVFQVWAKTSFDSSGKPISTALEARAVAGDIPFTASEPFTLVLAPEVYGGDKRTFQTGSDLIKHMVNEVPSEAWDSVQVFYKGKYVPDTVNIERSPEQWESAVGERAYGARTNLRLGNVYTLRQAVGPIPAGEKVVLKTMSAGGPGNVWVIPVSKDRQDMLMRSQQSNQIRVPTQLLGQEHWEVLVGDRELEARSGSKEFWFANFAHKSNPQGPVRVFWDETKKEWRYQKWYGASKDTLVTADSFVIGGVYDADADQKEVLRAVQDKAGFSEHIRPISGKGGRELVIKSNEAYVAEKWHDYVRGLIPPDPSTGEEPRSSQPVDSLEEANKSAIYFRSQGRFPVAINQASPGKEPEYEVRIYNEPPELKALGRIIPLGWEIPVADAMRKINEKGTQFSPEDIAKAETNPRTAIPRVPAPPVLLMLTPEEKTRAAEILRKMSGYLDPSQYKEQQNIRNLSFKVEQSVVNQDLKFLPEEVSQVRNYLDSVATERFKMWKYPDYYVPAEKLLGPLVPDASALQAKIAHNPRGEAEWRVPPANVTGLGERSKAWVLTPEERRAIETASNGYTVGLSVGTEGSTDEAKAARKAQDHFRRSVGSLLAGSTDPTKQENAKGALQTLIEYTNEEDPSEGRNAILKNLQAKISHAG